MVIFDLSPPDVLSHCAGNKKGLPEFAALKGLESFVFMLNQGNSILFDSIVIMAGAISAMPITLTVRQPSVIFLSIVLTMATKACLDFFQTETVYIHGKSVKVKRRLSRMYGKWRY